MKVPILTKHVSGAYVPETTAENLQNLICEEHDLSRIRVLIADDHELVRKGLLSILSLEKEIEVVGEARGGKEAVEIAKTKKPDMVLMDLRMPDMDGITATREIKSILPETKILVLTAHQNEREIFSALGAGISGYLLKDISPKDLVNAIRTISQGQSLLHPSVAKKVMERFSPAAEESGVKGLVTPLTSREQEVLNLLVQGYKNKDIAIALEIKEKTVKTHVSNVLRKLQQTDRTQAALFAIKIGLAEIKGVDQAEHF